MSGVRPNATNEVSGSADELARDCFERLNRVFGRYRSSAPRTRRRRNEAAVELRAAAHVMTVWHDDPRFVGTRGGPLPLRREGKAKSFEALVRAVDSRLNVGAVLDLLLRTGSVKRRNGRYWAVRKEVLVRSIPGALALRSLRAVNWMLRNADQNSRPASVAPPWLERCAENARFPVSRLVNFAQFLERETESYLSRLDEYMRAEEVNRRRGEPTVHLGVGMYRYQAEEEAKRHRQVRGIRRARR